MEAVEILQKYFGHKSFRSGQADIVQNILSGRDCLAVMPTGAGKSICYQVPAMMLRGTVVVISPLISLMKDQVDALTQSGISAAYINSTLSPWQIDDVLDAAIAGRLNILYVAPERLEMSGFPAVCGQLSIPLVAVDEAHCVSHWGQDFRPSYLKISEFVKSLKSRPVIAAFTATATDIVKEDIAKILELNDPFTVTTGFDRPNLYFEVRKPKSKQDELFDILKDLQGGSAIVYCSTRRTVETVCQELAEKGISAAMYHAGLSDNNRKTAQDDFIYDRSRVIVATNAFGMGIDKSNVSLVVHYNMPKDLESYYQEAGRAGRDGSPAKCILLYSGKDVHTAEFLIEHSHDNGDLSEEDTAEIKQRDHERLKQMTFYSTTTLCLRHFILNYFGENVGTFCGNCSNCNTNYDSVDITVEAQKILSCIFRLRQRNRSAGKNTIAAILVGSTNKSVSGKGYETLSTFGIMSGYTLDRVRNIIDCLIGDGYIEIENEYKTCLLTDRASAFIRSGQSIYMRLPKEKKPQTKAPAANVGDIGLLTALKALRKQIASELLVPAYIVFTDATLIDMSEKKPRTIDELLNVNGVGHVKAERYGNVFLARIKEYLAQKGD